MKYLLVILALLLGCSANNEVTPKQPNSLAGDWMFNGTTISGVFTITNVKEELTVTEGYFTINGGYTYKVLNAQKVLPTKIFLESSNSYLVLLKYSVSGDYNTITSALFEYDTDITPTTAKNETVIITRKK